MDLASNRTYSKLNSFAACISFFKTYVQKKTLWWQNYKNFGIGG